MQDRPRALQRAHWKLNPDGSGRQSPVSTFTVAPTTESPTTMGRDFNVNAVGVPAIGPTRLAYALVVPFESVARTSKLSVRPTSVGPIRRLRFVTPRSGLHREPIVSQLYHWKAYKIAPEPFHEPCVANKRAPWVGDPATLGATTDVGLAFRVDACADRTGSSAVHTIRTPRTLTAIGRRPFMRSEVAFSLSRRRRH